MEEMILVAQFRTDKGKEKARKLRRQGLIPAVVYGQGEAPIPVSLSVQDLTKVLRGAAGERALINLTIEGLEDGSITKTVILKEKQITPVKRTLLHADLYTIVMDEEISVDVPIQIVGKAAGVEEGGVTEQILREIEVRCLPADIPPSIEVDVTALSIGDAIHVRDIVLEKGEILADPEQAIVTVVPPTVLEEAAPEEEMIEEEEEEAEAEEKEETEEKEQE